MKRKICSPFDPLPLKGSTSEIAENVAALKAGELVDALSNAGPFTVFAPTNAAFDKLPKGTVEDLLKPANKSKLQDILQHHVTLSALDVAVFQDGQSLGMVDGTNAIIKKKDGATYIGDAKVLASVRASNGFVHVVDGVVFQPISPPPSVYFQSPSKAHQD